MKHTKRRNATSPLSAGWTLYKSDVLAEKLGIEITVLDKALEETGFNKAVRIREAVIKQKEILRKRERELMFKEQELQQELTKVKAEHLHVSEMLGCLRDILRIPREYAKSVVGNFTGIHEGMLVLFSNKQTAFVSGIDIDDDKFVVSKGVDPNSAMSIRAFKISDGKQFRGLSDVYAVKILEQK